MSQLVVSEDGPPGLLQRTEDPHIQRLDEMGSIGGKADKLDLIGPVYNLVFVSFFKKITATVKNQLLC